MSDIKEEYSVPSVRQHDNSRQYFLLIIIAVLVIFSIFKFYPDTNSISDVNVVVDVDKVITSHEISFRSVDGNIHIAVVRVIGIDESELDKLKIRHLTRNAAAESDGKSFSSGIKHKLKSSGYNVVSVNVISMEGTLK